MMSPPYEMQLPISGLSQTTRIYSSTNPLPGPSANIYNTPHPTTSNNAYSTTIPIASDSVNISSTTVMLSPTVPSNIPSASTQTLRAACESSSNSVFLSTLQEGEASTHIKGK